MIKTLLYKNIQKTGGWKFPQGRDVGARWKFAADSSLAHRKIA